MRKQFEMDSVFEGGGVQLLRSCWEMPSLDHAMTLSRTGSVSDVQPWGCCV